MKLVGIFSERDFVNAIARDGAAVLAYDVQKLMSSPIISCRLTDRIDAALAMMTIGRIRHLPVTDNGDLKGIEIGCNLLNGLMSHATGRQGAEQFPESNKPLVSLIVR